MNHSVRQIGPPGDDAPLVQVAVAPTEGDAELLVERLADAGIEALVQIEEDVHRRASAFGILSWDYPVLVPESDAVRAQMIIREFGPIDSEQGPGMDWSLRLIGSLIIVGATLILTLALMARIA